MYNLYGISNQKSFQHHRTSSKTCYNTHTCGIMDWNIKREYVYDYNCNYYYANYVKFCECNCIVCYLFLRIDGFLLQKNAKDILLNVCLNM